jgi:hypothetical protein
VAAPVGHIVCALAFLNSDATHIADRNAFLVGTNFPDIRYISDVHRSITHKLEDEGLAYVLAASSSFEIGRRFHVFVDHEREKHMKAHDAYRFVKNGPLKTQMLKIIEDHIMFNKLKGKFDPYVVFGRVYEDEQKFFVTDAQIKTWHSLLTTYLDQRYWFNCYRYYITLCEFQRAYGLPNHFFENMWVGLRTFGFFIYAYFQVEKLSRNKELRAIILDFYENQIEKIIRASRDDGTEKTVELHSLDPPFFNG